MKWTVKFYTKFEEEFDRLNAEVQDELWRVAFAYDPKRQAILLVSGNKSGVSESRFYKELIRKADERFSLYLSELKRGDLS